MNNNRKQKAPALLKSKRLAIAKDSVKFPELTFAELAKKHNCTEPQVAGAVKKYNEGGLESGRKRQPVKKIEEIIAKNDDPLIIIKRQFLYSAASLEAASYYNPDERINSLHKLAVIGGLIDKQELQSHMKGADADFIAFLFREFIRPDLSDAEIVKKYHQYHEKWKNTVK